MNVIDAFFPPKEEPDLPDDGDAAAPRRHCWLVAVLLDVLAWLRGKSEVEEAEADAAESLHAAEPPEPAAPPGASHPPREDPSECGMCFRSLLEAVQACNQSNANLLKGLQASEAWAAQLERQLVIARQRSRVQRVYCFRHENIFQGLMHNVGN